MKIHALILIGCGLLFVGIKDSCAAKRTGNVIVVTDVTTAGRLVAPPTRGQPVFYVAAAGQYREFGDVIAGERRPSPAEAKTQVTRALAGQGYLPAGAATAPPSLVIVYNWGTLNPMIDDRFGTEAEPKSIVYNQEQMLAMLGGDKIFQMPENSFVREDLLAAAGVALYFIVISAYDAKELQAGIKNLLWRTRVAVPAQGLWMPDAFPDMIASGALHFGRETAQPAWVRERDRQRGNVTMGELEILGMDEDQERLPKSSTPVKPPRR